MPPPRHFLMRSKARLHEGKAWILEHDGDGMISAASSFFGDSRTGRGRRRRARTPRRGPLRTTRSSRMTRAPPTKEANHVIEAAEKRVGRCLLLRSLRASSVRRSPTPSDCARSIRRRLARAHADLRGVLDLVRRSSKSRRGSGLPLEVGPPRGHRRAPCGSARKIGRAKLPAFERFAFALAHAAHLLGGDVPALPRLAPRAPLRPALAPLRRTRCARRRWSESSGYFPGRIRGAAWAPHGEG